VKKILTAAQTREADAFTIVHEPISSIELMERASLAFLKAFDSYANKDQKVYVVVGPGNNGGDGLAIARLLAEKGTDVTVVVAKTEKRSPDAQVNLNRLGFEPLIWSEDIDLSKTDIIIDALFGSGLDRPLSGNYVQMIQSINKSQAKVVAVDVPSGLMVDTAVVNPSVVKADLTITFQRPKLSFFFPQSGTHCGQVVVVDIGLDENFIESQSTNYYVLEASDVRLSKREKFGHKGQYGHVQVFAGSKGKMGAAVLCAQAVMRVGAGLVTAHVPKRGEVILQTCIPEAMITLDEHADFVSTGGVMEKANVLCIGPGLGLSPATLKWMSQLLVDCQLPLLIDADAINLIAQDHTLLDSLAGKAIMTPHLGELERLIGPFQNGLEALEKTKRFASRYDVVMLIKGAHSAVVLPNGEVIFNQTGNPGIATAGSGDVLSGMVAGFLAQGVNRKDALLRAIYYHGLAGDFAAKGLGEPSIMASDLLKYIPIALCNVENSNNI
jgi:hydroxyethylthiazole kinase-like uncharacterized protein yjeF